MKRILSTIVMLAGFLLATPSAMADWTGCRLLDNNCVDYEIKDIFDRIDKANDTLDRNAPVMDLYRKQRAHWSPLRENTRLLTDGIGDVLDRLPNVRLNYLDFVGSPKCAPGSNCFGFQADLVEFFEALSDLNKKFPALERAGLHDKERVTLALLEIPPVVLFGIYRTLENIPDWRRLPQDLSDIFDEIGDPDVFDMNLQEATVSSDALTFGSTGRTTISAFRDTTKTQRFCARRADKFDGTGRGLNGNRDGWDQIRLNRVILVTTLFSDIWKFGLEQVPDDIDIGVSLLGEGGFLGIPSVAFTWMFKIVPLATESILKAVETHRQNIGICRDRFDEIEGRLASCRYFTEFVLDVAAREEYYALMERRFEMADAAGISHSKSDFFMSRSESKLAAGQFPQAFEHLCEAYRSIGVSR